MLKIQDFLCERISCSVQHLVRGFISAKPWHCSKNLLRNQFSEQNLFVKHEKMYRNSNTLPPNMLNNQGKALPRWELSVRGHRENKMATESPLGQDISPYPSQQSHFQVGPGWEMALECFLQTHSAISLLYFLITELSVTPSSFRAPSCSPTPIFAWLSNLLRVAPFQSCWHMIHQLSMCSSNRELVQC